MATSSFSDEDLENITEYFRILLEIEKHLELEREIHEDIVIRMISKI